MPRYLSSGIHPITGYDKLSNLAREKLDRPRLGIWVQDYQYNTGDLCNDLIQWVKDTGCTDVFLLAVDTNGQDVLLGYAGSCNDHITAVRVDGMYPFLYLTRNLRPLGVKIHAWWCIFFWSWWGGTPSFVNTPIESAHRDTTSYNQQMIRLCDSDSQQFIADILWDFAHNNRMADGVDLDYIRADGTSTVHAHTDITSTVQAIHDHLPDREISVCSIGAAYAERSGSGTINQRPRNMASNGYCDTVGIMAYETILGEKLEQTYQIHNNNGVDILHGFAALPDWDRPNDLAMRLQLYIQKGFRHFMLFDFGSSSWKASTYKAIAQGININSNLQALYPDIGSITKITVNQGTNVIITIDGSDHTITWANMGLPTETRAGYIKDNAESTVGHSLKPFLFDWHDPSLHLICGDFFSQG